MAKAVGMEGKIMGGEDAMQGRYREFNNPIQVGPGRVEPWCVLTRLTQIP